MTFEEALELAEKIRLERMATGGICGFTYLKEENEYNVLVPRNWVGEKKKHFVKTSYDLLNHPKIRVKKLFN